MTYPNEYGAILVAGTGAFGAFGTYTVRSDGGLEPAPLTLEEAGLALKNREDGFRALAAIYMTYSPISHMLRVKERGLQILKAAQDWHVDGLIYCESIGCYGEKMSGGEALRRFELAEIPHELFRYNHNDPRNYDRAEIKRKMASFMERLGLTKLSDTTIDLSDD